MTYEIEKLTGTLRNYDSCRYMTVTINLQEVWETSAQAPSHWGTDRRGPFHHGGLGQFGKPSWFLWWATADLDSPGGCMPGRALIVRLWAFPQKEGNPETHSDEPEKVRQRSI
ncbi:MAG: hypothetical protein ACLRXC_13180 [[Clostridium] leptum]